MRSSSPRLLAVRDVQALSSVGQLEALASLDDVHAAVREPVEQARHVRAGVVRERVERVQDHIDAGALVPATRW